MNVLFAQSKRTVNEISTLASTKQFFISYKNARPKIGQAQDSVIGLATMTESSVRISKLHSMQLFAHTPVYPEFKKDKLPYTGRELISLLLQKTQSISQRKRVCMMQHMRHTEFMILMKLMLKSTEVS
jgi:DNA-directed RNA polymerase beta' subunit